MKDKKQKVEDLGVVFEQLGRPPIVGRLFALLLLSEPPEMSFDQIREYLGASKSSVSNAINLLLKEGTVRYVTYSGDRKRYFKIDTKKWFNLVKDSSKQLGIINELLDEVLQERDSKSYVEFNNDIKRILDFQLYLNKAIAKAIDEWDTN